jgi:hypothetical protein
MKKMLFTCHFKVNEIAYGFGDPSEKKCQSSLIFYCKIPILCQSLAKSDQSLMVLSNRNDKFRELYHFNSDTQVF